MSLRDHIYDLRYRLGLAMLFIGLGGVWGFVWWDLHIGAIPSLADLIIGPYCSLDPKLRFPPEPCGLLQTQPFEAFLVRFKVGVAVGAVLTSPGWLYQLWAFIAPGLY